MSDMKNIEKASQITFSVVARILLNVEALNMAETVGNVSRHRKAPIVIVNDKGASIFYVPAISGESLAYHYQKLLASIAHARGLPVTSMDIQGYFMKFSDDNIINSYYKEVKLADAETRCEIERRILESSVVADVGGFLYTNKLVKRVSKIRFGYMVPALDAISVGAVASYPQLHVRYTPEAKKREQMIYNVETASTLYTFTASINISEIGKVMNYDEGCKDTVLGDRKQRIEAAVDALIAMVDGVVWGAKRSRFNPVWEVKSLVATVSKGPVEFIPSPATTKSFIKETIDRALNIAKIFPSISILVTSYTSEGAEQPKITNQDRVKHEPASTHTEALIKAKEYLIEIIQNSK
jgi:CRISPR-associated protein Csa2